MKIKLKLSLETVIKKWMDGICDGVDRPEKGTIYPEMSEHMTTAAAAVFDATFRSQQYTRDET